MCMRTCLQHRVHVARVAQVGHPHKPSRATEPLQGTGSTSRFRDSVELEGAIQVDLHLRHRLVSLGEFSGVDPPVLEVPAQLRVQHHVVLVGGVRVDVPAAVGRDGAQLDSEGVAFSGLFIVLEGGAAASGPVPVGPTAADVALVSVLLAVLLLLLF